MNNITEGKAIAWSAVLLLTFMFGFRWATILMS